MSVELPGVNIDDAVFKVQQALSQEGFGVLADIDVSQTLKKKLDVDFTPYRILGACNPGLAHQALSHEPLLGLLLPCNVIVQEISPGNCRVAAINPVELFKIVDNPELAPIAAQVGDKLKNVMQAIGKRK
jgi:uncharacterized protein (DUF302 family)